MTEVNKNLKINGLNIVIIVFIIYTIATQNWNFIIDTIIYIKNLQSLDFWFLILHIKTAYLLLVSLKIELGFHASIKFN